MSSHAKLEPYKLNSWELTDKPTMDDFNQDNIKINNALGKATWDNVSGKPASYPRADVATKADTATKATNADYATTAGNASLLQGHSLAVGGGIVDMRNKVPCVSNGGHMEIGQVLDFHVSYQEDYAVKLTANPGMLDISGNLTVNGLGTFSTIKSGDATIGRILYYKNNAYVDNVVNQQLLTYASREPSFGTFLGVRDGGWSYTPTVSNNLALGSPSAKWKEVYANNGSIITSDATKKRDIAPIAESEKMMALMLQLRPVSYRFIEELSSSGRTHMGLIAQEVEQAMEACDISSAEFAGFIKSPVYEQIEKTNEDGAKYTVDGEIIPDKFEYGLRYEEFIAPLLALVQKQQTQLDAQQTQINALSARLDALGV